MMQANSSKIAALILLAGFASHVPAKAQEATVPLDTSFLVQSWYFALMPAANEGARAASTERMTGLIAEGAQIELRDIGVTQTKAEFLESLDQWFDAMETGRIAYRIDSVDDSNVTTVVCYDFGTSQALNRESFSLADGLITGSVQERTADDCSGF